MVGRAALGCAVLCCLVLCVVVLCGPHRGGVCCVSVWPPSWWGVLRWGAVCCVFPRCVLWWCVAPLVVGRAVLVWGAQHGGAVLRCVLLCCVAVRCVMLCCVAWWCVAPLVVGHAAPVCGPPHGWAWCVGVRFFVLLGFVLCVVVVVGPPHGGTCCTGVWPPALGGVLRWGAVCCVVWLVCRCAVWSPSWWGVLRWCLASLMVGGAALWCSVLCFTTLCVVVVCGPPHGGACRDGLWPLSWWDCVALCLVVWCGGVWPPSCRGVLRRCVAPLMVGPGALGCVVLCCLALCCVSRWCVAPVMVGRAALVCGPPLGGACCVGVWCIVLRGVVLCVVVCGPPYGGAHCVGVWPPSWWGVLCWCVAPPMVGRAGSVCSGFDAWCFSSLLGLFCWFVVVSAALRPALSGLGCVLCLPGQDEQAGLPSACGAPSPLSWPTQTARPLERVWCATPCFCFAGVVPLPLVFPCSPPAFLCSRGSLPCFAVWRCLLLSPPSYPTPALRVLSSAPPLPRGVAAPAGGCCPPPPSPGAFVFRPLASWSAFSFVLSFLSVPSGCSAPLGRLLAPPAHPPLPGVFVSRMSSPPPLAFPRSPSAFLCAAGPFVPPPRLCASGSSCCCLVLAGVGALCCLVLCFAVLCCCLLCCVVRGAVCRVLLCRVLVCFGAGVVLR